MPRRPFRVGRSDTGLGLFATEPIKKGAFIVAYRGRRITNAEADELEARGSRYMFEINSRWTIDGSSRRNLARYVNHSCRPNAEAVERKKGIVYVARRRIRPEEEITVDYGSHGRRTYRKGQSLIEAMHVAHFGENTGAEPLRLIAVYMGSSTAKDVVPVK